MDTPYPSFQLAEFVPPDGLTGRNCGTMLETGMTFDTLSRTLFCEGIEDMQSEAVGALRTISLKLTRIEAYKHTLDELSPGMTALLEFTGETLDKIRDELSQLPEREYLTIECRKGE